jgi:hypothetical protein
MGAEFFQMDGRTDMTERTVDFRIFAKAPKKNEDGVFVVESQLCAPSVLNHKYLALLYHER